MLIHISLAIIFVKETLLFLTSLSPSPYSLWEGAAACAMVEKLAISCMWWLIIKFYLSNICKVIHKYNQSLDLLYQVLRSHCEIIWYLLAALGFTHDIREGRSGWQKFDLFARCQSIFLFYSDNILVDLFVIVFL